MKPIYRAEPRWLTAVAIISAVALMIGSLLAGLQPTHAQHAAGTTAMSPGTSYLYRFDATAQTFITIPLAPGSQPIGLAVTGTHPTHVWFTEYGRNRIGHVIYTGTADYQLNEYLITSTADSGPYRLTIDGNDIWLTERGANRVGRLNANTGQIDEFDSNGLSPNSGLSDIKVGPNGWVWIGGEWSQRLVRLIVTSTTAYTFTEYSNVPTYTVAPYALAIDPSQYLIYFTNPTAPKYKIGVFDPFNNLFIWPSGYATNSWPLDIVTVPGETWFANFTHNSLDQIAFDTLSFVNSFGNILRPAGLAAQSSHVFWFTQQNDQGALGRFEYISSTLTLTNSYPLPTSGLLPTGIAVASDQGVWLAAYRPLRLYLPTIMR